MEAHVEDYAGALLEQWGAPGIVVVGLAYLYFYLLRQHKSERREIQQGHAEERLRWAAMDHERMLTLQALTERSLKAFNDTQDVLRDLSHIIGALNARHDR